MFNVCWCLREIIARICTHVLPKMRVKYPFWGGRRWFSREGTTVRCVRLVSAAHSNGHTVPVSILVTDTNLDFGNEYEEIKRKVHSLIVTNYAFNQLKNHSCCRQTRIPWSRSWMDSIPESSKIIPCERIFFQIWYVVEGVSAPIS
jgi:hypothetical protein